MNGPAYALLTLVVLVGVSMAVSAVVRNRRRPRQWDRRETWLHLGLVVLWIGTLALIPVVAEPGDQPWLGTFANGVNLILFFAAVRDLRDGRTKNPRQPGDHTAA